MELLADIGTTPRFQHLRPRRTHLARLSKVLTGHPHETLGIIASQPEKPPNIHSGAERLIIKAAVFAAMDLIAHLFSLTSAFVSKRSMSTHSSPSRFST